ncbi:hypothetical protein Trydic_g12095 [Trypoxylus dichotomus]
MNSTTLLFVFVLTFSRNSARITKVHSIALKAICVEMVKHIFPDSYCLYYISNTAVSEVPFINYCLKNLNASVVIMNPENNVTPIGKQIPCNGYLVVSANYTTLKKLFMYRYGRSFEFQTRKRILMLYVGDADFMVPPFSTVADLKGNDIVVLDKLPNYERDFMRRVVYYGDGEIEREDDSIDENVTIRASSVRENKILREWNYLTDDLDRSLIKFTSWKPNFKRENGTFKVACFACPPYVYVNHKNEAFDGIDYQIIKLITSDWPVTFHVHNFSLYDEMYSGIIRTVRDGRNDLGACSIWLRVVDTRKLSMTITYSEICSTFLAPKPFIVKSAWFVLHPMNTIVWILIAIMTLIVAILIKFAPKSGEVNYNYFAYTLVQSIRVLALGPLNRFPAKPHYVFKIVLGIWLYSCLILTTGYNAGISSVLTYPTFTEEIKTVDDMVKQNIYWGSVTTGLRDDLIRSGDPDVVKLANNFKLERDLNVKNARIRTNKYAVAVKTVANKYVTDTCYLSDYARKTLKIVQECYATNNLVYVLKANSPHKELLDRRLLRATEHGLVQFWTNRILNKYGMSYMRQFYTNFNTIAIAYRPLSLMKLRGIFYFLIIGYCAALIVFIGEYWYDLYKRSTYMLYSPRLRVKN